MQNSLRTVPTAYVEFVGPSATPSPADDASAGTVETIVDGAASELVKLGPASEVLQTFDTEPGSEPTHIALDAAATSSSATQRRQFPVPRLQTERYPLRRIHLRPGHPARLAHAASPSATPPASSTRRATIPKAPTSPSSPSPFRAAHRHRRGSHRHRAHHRDPARHCQPEGFDTEYHFEYVTRPHSKPKAANHGPDTETTTSTDLGLGQPGRPVQAAISGLDPYALPLAGRRRNSEGTTRRRRRNLRNPHRRLGPRLHHPDRRPRTGHAQSRTQPQWPAVRIHHPLRRKHEATTMAAPPRRQSPDWQRIRRSQQPPSPASSRTPTTTTSSSPTTPNGEDETTDQTFTTEHSSAEEREAENCPNTNLREENNSLSLPDCRAYEKITADRTRKAARHLRRCTPFAQRRTRLYFSEGAFAGAVQNNLAIPYIAHRTEAGWVTQAVVCRPAPPPTEPPLHR